MKPKYTQILISQLKIFTQLTSLTIGNVCGKQISSLELPSLKYLVITSCNYSKWMQNFDKLKNLEYIIEHNCIHEHNLIWPINLKRLKVFYTQKGDNEIVYTSLSHLSQLESLIVYDNAWSNPPPNGQKWEKLIVSSLPLLENFQFCFKFWKDSGLLGDVNQIISTFATPFYVKEKCWFIQCDVYYQQFSAALLYSLPFAFDCFEIVTHSFEKSLSTANTYCTQNKNTYGNVKTLIVNVDCENLSKDLFNRNITHLVLKCSGTPANWLFSMQQLRQLSLSSHIDMSSMNFTRLLSNTPCLQSLNVSYKTLNILTDHWKNETVCEQLSQKIRSLNLCFDEYLPAHSQNYVKVDELLSIIRVFDKRCQHLTVAVYSRNVVAGLILRTMKRLRSLKVYLNEHGNLKITQDWLQEQDIILKNLDCFITTENNEYSFWFDNLR